MSQEIDILQHLLAEVGPAGSEASRLEIIAKLASPLVDQTIVDRLGNLILHKQGNGKTARKMIFAAQADTPGLMVYGIDENGFLNVRSLGKIAAGTLAGKTVRFKNGGYGVARLRKNYADFSEKAMSSLTVRDDICLDIGATSKAEAALFAEVGTTCVLDGEVRELACGRVSGFGVGELAGAVALICALERLQQSDCQLTAVFYTQGCMGARPLAAASFNLRPDTIVLCGTVATDDLRGGLKTLIMDASAVYDRQMSATIQSLADKNAISCSPYVVSAAANDEQRAAMSIQQSGINATVASICIPASNKNGTAAVVEPCDINWAAQLLVKLAETA